MRIQLKLASLLRRALSQRAQHLARAAVNPAPEPKTAPPAARVTESAFEPPKQQWTVLAPGEQAPGTTPRTPLQPYERVPRQADRFPPSQPDETLAQYALRTAKDTGFNVAHLGALLHLGDPSAPKDASHAERIDRFMRPTAYWSDAELDRQNSMRERDIQAASRVNKGPVNAAGLTQDEKSYLYAASADYRQRTGGRSLHWDLLGGAVVDVNRAINDGFYNGGAGLSYQGPLRAEVDRLLAQHGR